MIRYETAQEAQTRLQNTFFLFRREPVYCQHVNYGENEGDILLDLVFMPRQNEKVSVKLDDPDLDYRNFSIGYLNLAGGATFVYRVPVRKYKQGLYEGNIKTTGIDGLSPSVISASQVFGAIGFKDMLNNRYPSMNEAVDRLMAEDDLSSVAFDRCFSLSADRFRRDFNLFYKGEKIAFGRNEFELPEQFLYMKDVLKKTGISVR